MVESTPTKDPFQSPDGDQWRRESAPSDISPGGVLTSVPASTPPAEALGKQEDGTTSRVGGVIVSAPASSPKGWYDYESSSTPYHGGKWTPPPKLPPKEGWCTKKCLQSGTEKTQRVNSETGSGNLIIGND